HGEEGSTKNLLQRFFASFNRGFDRMTNKYQSVLLKSASRKGLTLGLLGLFFVLIYGTAAILPSGFIPTEDQGMIYVSVTAPQGSTVERTEKVLDEVLAEAETVEAVDNVTTLAGYSLVNEIAGSSYGMGMINLKPWDDRNESVDDIISILKEKTKHISDAQIEIFSPPTVPGFGNASGYELRLLDKTGGAVSAVSDVTKEFVEALNKSAVVKNNF